MGNRYNLTVFYTDSKEKIIIQNLSVPDLIHPGMASKEKRNILFNDFGFKVVNLTNSYLFNKSTGQAYGLKVRNKNSLEYELVTDNEKLNEIKNKESA